MKAESIKISQNLIGCEIWGKEKWLDQLVVSDITNWLKEKEVDLEDKQNQELDCREGWDA